MGGAIAAKLALTIFLTGFSLFLIFRPGRLQAAVIKYDTWLLILSRAGLFVLIYLVFKTPVPSDLSGYYYPQAQAALDGQFPYRDFKSSYGAGFAYLNAALLWIWNDARMLFIWPIVAEICTYLVWKRLWQHSARRTEMTVLYIFNPLCVINVAVVGQNQVLVAVMVAVCMLLRHRPATAFLVSAGVAFVKFVAVLFAPAFFIATRKRFLFALFFVLSFVVYAALCAAAGANVLHPLQTERGFMTAGNVTFWLFGLASVFTDVAVDQGGVIRDFILLVIYSSVCGWLLLRYNSRTLLSNAVAIALIGLTMMLFSKKSYASCLVIFWLPLIFALIQLMPVRRAVLVLSVYNVLASMGPSLWFNAGKRVSIAEMVEMPTTRRLIFLGWDLAFVAVGLYLFIYLLKTTRKSSGSRVAALS